MSDIHALSGAYAVDALDEAERAEFEKHLSTCTECRAEVASFRETTAVLTGTEAEDPPTGLRASVLAGISQVRPFPPETPALQAPGPVTPLVRLRRRMLPTLVAAAAVLVLVTAGALAWHPWHSGGQTSVADQVLNAPDAVRVTEKLPGGAGELTLVRSASLQKAVMVGDGVPEPPSGKTYELWLKQPGKGLVPAGLMPDSREATLLTGDPSTATAAAVSVEPATGSAQPTGQVVAVFPLTT